ncbi:hypothetical protein BGZ54_005196 [Gamsiella multidivaricata]|nr:hypothetical protein BGZ54_005196 [Gamsiella multidivaricata]
MRFPRATELAITAKEFAQWLARSQPHYSRHTARPASVATSPADPKPDQIANPDLQGCVHSVTSDPSHGPRNIAIAVSGGVDSMALVTLLARHYKSQESNRTGLHALIVDHKLRDNSAEEAAFVAQQVQKLDVMPHILTLSWKSMNDKDFSSTKGTSNDSDQGDGAISHRPDKIHLETRARLERYKAIAQQCHALQIKDLFVGHHAGDQVETVIFRFSRASGIDGLAGIQDMTLLGVVHVAEALDIRVIRPLLNVSKERLRATCKDAGIQWVEDPSNRSLDYQRNVIRHYQHELDAQVAQDPQSRLRPLSTSALLAFRERMDQHRRFVWDQVKPWLRDIWFDSDNGVCHIKLQTAPVPNNIAASTNMGWLQESETHVATRILSFLVRWVNCKDHSPRLEDIQTLLNHLRQPPVESSSSIPGPPVPAIEHEDDASSTVYRRKKTRASKHRLGMRQTAQSQDPGYVMNDQRAELSTTLLTRQPVNIAGVLFTPPRKTKGVLDHWTLSRQPMSSAEQLAASVCADLDTQVDLVWDQRFFIRIEPSPGLPGSAMSLRQSHLRVRPLAASDVPTIQRLLETDPQHGEDSNKLKTWMFIVSGKVRFTIPVICYMEEHSLRTDELNPSTNTKFGRRGSLSERVVSLPTLGINMFPSGLVTKSWFKSNAPADARDIRDYLLCETRKGQ